MPTVTIQLPHHTYDIIIEGGILAETGNITRKLAPHARCALFADESTFAIHGQTALSALQSADYSVTTSTIPSGESHKTPATVQSLYDALLADHLERKSPVLALGGGVTGDTVGFVAATYLRGVPFIQIPTTLLAMVDASVGGKVGVNVPQGKNLIGAFYQPHAVLMDPFVLQTLHPRELRCGLAECVKHGVIRSPELFDFIASNVPHIQALKTSIITDLLERNVKIKASVVIEDEKESGVRAHLNFGHTFAHAIEATSGYGQILHGEAVALGMIAASRMAENLNICPTGFTDKLTQLLNAIGLPITADLADTDQLMDAMLLDKKVKDSRIRFVLPEKMGSVIIRNDIPPDAVRDAWTAIRA